MISRSLTDRILDYPLLDSFLTFSFSHLGNTFGVVLFPHRWIYEMIEAWYSGGILGFGSDSEDARGIGHSPAIAGAYFAAKLGIVEYLSGRGLQAGAVVLREIRPEYAIPVGAWQIREGVREAMRRPPTVTDSFDDALSVAAKKTSVSKSEWLAHGSISKMMRQKTLSDFA